MKLIVILEDRADVLMVFKAMVKKLCPPGTQVQSYSSPEELIANVDGADAFVFDWDQSSTGSGEKALHHVRTTFPDAACGISSGNTIDAPIGACRYGIPFLAKPYGVEAFEGFMRTLGIIEPEPADSSLVS